MHKCPKCGETENFHYNYDYSKAHRPVVDILCNNCGELFPPVLKLLKEEPKQENCCTPVGQIKRYVDCKGCDRKPKQELTLEEAAEKYSTELLEAKTIEPHEKTWIKSMFIYITKYQSERMYSEENLYSEIENLIIMWSNDGTKTAGALTRQIMEQFKKTK